MSTNINDYVRPTDFGSNRKDINRILSLIHDIVAQEPESEGNKERIMFTPHVKLRTTTVTFGSPNVIDTDIRNRENFVFRRVKPQIVNIYSLTHSTSGTLTFPVSSTKFGAACEFDGSAFITITHDALLNLGEITMGGCYYLPATDSGDTVYQGLIDKSVYALMVDPHSTASNQIRGRVVIGSTNFDVTGNFTPNAWNTILMTWKTPNLNLYINNVLVSTNTGASGSLDTNSNDITIG